MLVVLAAAVLTWLAYDLRGLSLDAQGRAEARVAHGLPQANRALALFAQAARGNLDPSPRIDEARFLLSLGRTTQAVDVLNAIVRTNPGNVVAWSLLASATAGNDPGREAAANEQLFSLFGHPFVDYAAQGTVFSPDGPAVYVPGRVDGRVESVRRVGSVVRFVGWAAAVTRSGQTVSVIPAAQVLILTDGRFSAGGTPTSARPDVARVFSVPVARAGFTVDVPAAQLAAGSKDQVQVFATLPGVASRLPVNCSPQPQAFGCSG